KGERHDGEKRDRVTVKILRERIVVSVEIKLEKRGCRPDEDGGENRGVTVIFAEELRSVAVLDRLHGKPEIESCNFFGDNRFVLQIRFKKEKDMNILKNRSGALAAVTIIFLLVCPAGWAKQKAKTDEGATHRAAGVQAADQRQYDQAVAEFTKAIEIN